MKLIVTGARSNSNLSLLGKTNLSVVGFLYMVAAEISRNPASQIYWMIAGSGLIHLVRDEIT